MHEPSWYYALYHLIPQDDNHLDDPKGLVASILQAKQLEQKNNTYGDEEDEGGFMSRKQHKRTYIKWNHARAVACIDQDYLGPSPFFKDCKFP